MKDNYIVIQGWMRELGIGGNDLLAYALVFGFSQDRKSRFSGGLDYVMSWLGCNRKTACSVMARLTERGLLKKETVYDGALKYCEYKAVVPSSIDHSKIYYGDGKNYYGDDSKNYHGAMVKITPNNKDTKIKEDKRDSTYTPLPPFDLYKALLAEGVNAATAHDWLQVRKTKRLANTETGWKETLAEIRKTGYSAEYCIRTAVAQGWGGFRADWLDRLLNGNGAGPARARKVDNITYMLEQRERRMAAKARQKGESYDINDLPDEQ